MKNRNAIERTLIIRKEMEALNEYLKKIKNQVRHNLDRAEQLVSKINSLKAARIENKKNS